MMAIEDEQLRKALYQRLLGIDALGDQNGNWALATYKTIPRFPASIQKKIEAFRTAKERENIKKVTDVVKETHTKLQKLLNTPTQKDEIKDKMQCLGQVRAYVATIDQSMMLLEADVPASVLNYMWDLLGGVEGGKEARQAPPANVRGSIGEPAHA